MTGVHAQIVTGVVVFHDGLGGDGHGSFSSVCAQNVLIVVILEVVVMAVAVVVAIGAGWKQIQLINVKVGRQKVFQIEGIVFIETGSSQISPDV